MDPKLTASGLALPKHLTDFEMAPPDLAGWEPDFSEGVPEDAGMERVGDSLLRLLYCLPDADKKRVFLDALRTSGLGRHRKRLFRDLAEAANRSDKEVAAMADDEKARLFCRKLARLDRRSATVVIAGALTELYGPVAKKLLAQLGADVPSGLEQFQKVRCEIPDSIWEGALDMMTREAQLTPEKKAVVEAIQAQVRKVVALNPMPFAVNGPPELFPLEKHLVALSAEDPARAKPLIAGLAQLNPSRAENWLVFGLAGTVEAEPQGVTERAWLLAGELYRWGDNPESVDKVFDRERLARNRDAVRVLFSDPALARGRKLVGEYLLRQLVEAGEESLAIELLTPELVRQYDYILKPILIIEAQRRAIQKDVDGVRALAAKFPEIRAQGVLITALRRAGQLEAALLELRNSHAGVGLPGERTLVEAGIADGFELVIPEDRDQQDAFTQRLEKVYDSEEHNSWSHPEICYCQALYQLMENDKDSALDALDTLLELPDRYPAVRAYRFLAALLSQDIVSIETQIMSLDAGRAEEVLTLLPTNLVKVGVRALALQDQPEALNLTTQFFYQHMPELLDSLLGHEDLLLKNRALQERFLDKNEGVPDPLQRWAGCQKALQLATQAQDTDLVARAIDGCLRINEPLLAAFQAKLLEMQMAACEDLDLKEELAERIAAANPEQAKACFYQLLHTYLGKNRPEDAWRVLEALRELKEPNGALQPFIRVLEPDGKQTSRTTTPGRKLSIPVSVAFFGGQDADKSRSEQVGKELARQHPGLTIHFEHDAWNARNWQTLVESVGRFDVICGSNFMRTHVSRGLRQRARELGKVFGFCRGRGTNAMSEAIVKAVEVHLARQGQNGASGPGKANG